MTAERHVTACELAEMMGVSTRTVAAFLAELKGDADARRELIAALTPELIEAFRAYLEAAPRYGGTDELLTCAEAAKIANASVETVRRAVRSGNLRADYVGRSPRISRDDLRAWMSREKRSRSPRSRAPPSAGRRPMAEAFAKLS